MTHSNDRQSALHQQNTTGQVFDLGNQMQIVKTNERSGEQAQQDLKDDSGSVLFRGSAAEILKNPSSALNAAKELLSAETLSIVKESGDAELLSKLTEFADEVVLSPENLAEDMVNQQTGATIFGDKLWGVLKNLMSMANSAELNDAVADFAKAAADNSAKDEIMNSLSANFRYLSEELAPGKAVSEELASAADALSGPEAARNFEALKPTLIKLIGYTEKSLLLSDETKNFLPLIIHNMSRYSNNPSALKESFAAILAIAENLKFSPETLAALTGDTEASALTEALEKLFDSFILHNAYISGDEKQSSLINSETASENAKLAAMTNLLAAGAKHMADRIDPAALTRVLSSVDIKGGIDSVRKMLGSVIPNTSAMRDALKGILGDFEQSRDLDALIDKLNVIINNIGDEEKKVQLAQGLNSVLNEMALDKNNTVTQRNSMDIFADFLTKNINNSFLHSLTDMNKGDMVQTMLTTPGVFTPLIHQFVPLDAFGIRAFGEMWIDPGSDDIMKKVDKRRGNGSGESGTGSHIFLCFDVENTGYFELEIYEKDKDLSVMLLCPENRTEEFRPIGKIIPKIAAENGYRVSDSIVDTLRVKRSLNQIFPKLSEQRSGLNVKV